MAHKTNRGLHNVNSQGKSGAFKSWEKLKRQILPLPPEHMALWRERLDREMREHERKQRIKDRV